MNGLWTQQSAATTDPPMVSKQVTKNDYSVQKQLSVTAQALYSHKGKGKKCQIATEGAEVTR